MKKIIYAFSTLLLVLASCSSDSDSPASPEDGVLLTRVVTTDPDGTITANLTYNGNKLLSIADNESYEENFTYTGDLITSTQEVEGGTVVMNNTFEYNSDGNLIDFKRFDGETGDEVIHESYVYNADGTVTNNHYDIEILDIDGNPYMYRADKLFFENGEIIKVVSTSYSLADGVPVEEGTSTKNFTYDTKNNPFKNVVGISKIFYAEGDLSYGGRLRNVLTQTRVGSSDSDTYEYTYNASNFPTSMTWTYNYSGGSDSETTQLFYE